MSSHTQVPTVLVLKDRLRVYFASRPKSGMSLPTFIDLDLEDPMHILQLYPKPILELGEAGMFDEHGIIPNHVFWHNGKVHLFYVGWSRRESIPYSNWMGLAISHDGGTLFEKAFRGPILDRTRDEAYSATGLICLRERDYWHGWYATGIEWLQIDGRYEHTYELRYCSSHNLIDWKRPNRPIFPTRLPHESNTRPTIVYLQDKWHMWFCYRGTQDFRDGIDGYRIGYAWSTNLIDWTREDNKAGITVSLEGWDSKMIAYPCVVSLGGRILMFYSGNGFGRDGFGYAELEVNENGL